MTTRATQSIRVQVKKIQKLNNDIYRAKKQVAAILFQTECKYGCDSNEAAEIRKLFWS